MGSVQEHKSQGGAGSERSRGGKRGAPETMPVGRILGNRALTHAIQARLEVSQPDYPCEREAERVADQIMGISAPGSGGKATGSQIQRACAHCDDELRRKPAHEEEELKRAGEGADTRRLKATLLDVAGKELAEHVDKMFRTDKDEAPVRDKALMDKLDKIKNRGVRVEEIYKRLRRAEITLARSWPGKSACTFTVPGHPEETYGTMCPVALISAAFPTSKSKP